MEVQKKEAERVWTSEWVSKTCRPSLWASVWRSTADRQRVTASETACRAEGEDPSLGLRSGYPSIEPTTIGTAPHAAAKNGYRSKAALLGAGLPHFELVHGVIYLAH